MRYAGFCGGSSPSQSPVLDLQQSMNLYLERATSQAAPADRVLYPTPGQVAHGAALGEVDLRGAHEVNGRCFVVMGGKLYEHYADGTSTLRGTVAQDANPSIIVDLGTVGAQMCISSGTNAYHYDLDTNVLTLVLTGEATMVDMIDGRFLAFDVTTGRVRMSAINDGLTWPALAFFERSQAPDPWQAMKVVNQQIWLVGARTSEAWYNAGNATQPFAQSRSSTIQFGTASPFSVGVVAGNLAFLSQTAEGAGPVILQAGYQPNAISTPEIAQLITTMEQNARISDCELMVYEQQQHVFACFTFPNGGRTLVFDVTTGEWHERGTMNTLTGYFDYWHPRTHVHAFGKHLVGDRTTGQISVLDPTSCMEADGSPVVRKRIGPSVWPASSRQQIQIAEFQLLVEPGLGVAGGPNDNVPPVAGSDPVVMFRSSRNGKRWSNERTARVGKLGESDRRVIFRNCGASRSLWVPEITMSDPIPWRILGANLEGAGFLQAGARG